MALLLDPTDRTPRFVEPDHLGKLTELRSRTLGAVAASDLEDSDMPTLPALVAELEAKRQAFAAIYESESNAAEHLVATIRQVGERAADFESAVREAITEGKPLPVPSGSEALVSKVISESREARLAAFPTVEKAAADFVTAARHAAGWRARLLAARLRKKLEACAPLHDALRQAEGRASATASMFNNSDVLAAATAAGFSEE